MATDSALQLEADDATNDALKVRLRAEFGQWNRQTEHMTRLACITQGTDNLWKLGQKIQALKELDRTY